MSGTERLAMGLGFMALGVFGAMPFHRARPPELIAASRLAQSSVALGEGVSLQVPGQTAVTGFQTPNLQPLPADDERREKVVETESRSDMAKISPPPRLPDQYHPLFRPDASGQESMGRVVTPGTESTHSPRPLRNHTIHDGDTLASLAGRYLGDSRRASEIWNANRSVLTDPEVLPIGVRIVIPRKMADATQLDVTESVDAETRNLVPLPAIGFPRVR